MALVFGSFGWQLLHCTPVDPLCVEVDKEPLVLRRELRKEDKDPIVLGRGLKMEDKEPLVLSRELLRKAVAVGKARNCYRRALA